MPGPLEALSLMPDWYWLLSGIALGACLASFACVLAERIPARRSILGRSRCQCGRPLHARENVPVVGWLVARGRTACCDADIPAAYVLAEVGGGLLVGLASYAAGPLGLLTGALVVAAGLLVGLMARR